MEIICRIQQQDALEEREYESRQTGNREKFASMGFHLVSGGDSLYCEMIQEQARKQVELSKDFYYKATLSFTERTFTDKNGKTRYENSLMLTKICVL